MTFIIMVHYPQNARTFWEKNVIMGHPIVLVYMIASIGVLSKKNSETNYLKRQTVLNNHSPGSDYSPAYNS